MNLPVTFAIDRAGIVGEDGETHQGAFDISYLRFIPNMTLLAPRDDETLKFAIEFGYKFQTPCAIRYPRGSFDELEFSAKPFILGEAEILKKGDSKKVFIGYGKGVSLAIQTAKLSSDDITIVDLKFVKPLDKILLKKLSSSTKQWYIFSDSQKQGGVASAILEFLADEKLSIDIVSFEYEDIFIQHGNTNLIKQELSLLPQQLIKRV
jgi:1-deoxy-D-xylulose-5-phosphate synthase